MRILWVYFSLIGLIRSLLIGLLKRCDMYMHARDALLS